MLSKELKAQVSDTTGDEQQTTAGNKQKNL
jgi:hypothetical protein